MPKRKPIHWRKPARALREDEQPDNAAPEAALRPQRTASSDMERALPHPASSEETGGHTDRDDPGVSGFLEPGTPGADAPQSPAG
ncbi:hypothetical protein [Hydrogenophaga sp. PBL-H3]|uniref:hypothetical protein n=1 Tax=Hydrogenophaga sp. PBL-H3 TaxID=434010 RepID=UPI001320297C|nr:hypothetical protein [Hydrogenophaga sp. PBL-H3]QHE75045.1 hypothetical protein F9Z45_02740 [Hydrogenophaga sp. PBL-H3]QHE79472.1 hypothetical protein F9Z44_02740 [Hydrogenophaga sp. PBL-H3]